MVTLGVDPAPLLHSTDPAAIVTSQALAQLADHVLDEQHERAAAHIAAKISQLF
jgi:hypothetical protein